jgi:hypothetical protein
MLDEQSDLILFMLKEIRAKQDEHTVALQEICEVIDALRAQGFSASQRRARIASEPEVSNWHLTGADAPDV